MAIYEYVCPHCREVFEVVRPMKMSNKSVNCPKCHTKGKTSASLRLPV